MCLPFLSKSYFVFPLDNLNLLVYVRVFLCNLLVVDVLALVSQEILLLLASVVHSLFLCPHVLKPILQFLVFNGLLYASKERILYFLILFL